MGAQICFCLFTTIEVNIKAIFLRDSYFAEMLLLLAALVGSFSAFSCQFSPPLFRLCPVSPGGETQRFSTAFQLDALGEFLAPLRSPRSAHFSWLFRLPLCHCHCCTQTRNLGQSGGVGALSAPQKCIFCSRISGKNLSRVSVWCCHLACVTMC